MLDYYEIGQRIRKKRKGSGLSQEELAERVGISVTHMSHIETGNTKLSLPVLVKLSQALDCGTDDLLFERAGKEEGLQRDLLYHLLEDCNEREITLLYEICKAVKRTCKQDLI